MPVYDDPWWTDAGPEEHWDVDRKFTSLAPGFAHQVTTLTERLAERGWRPLLWFAWRAPERQEDLFAQHRSRVELGLHNVLDPLAMPAALAADLVDARSLWGMQTVSDPARPGQTHEVPDPRTFDKAASFFRDLGHEAHALGLWWGGDFQRETGSPWAEAGLGWDPGHVQAVSNTMLPEMQTQTRRAQSALAERRRLALV